MAGSSGSINAACERCPFALLDSALSAVPSPPYDETSWRGVYRWLAEVQQGIVSRREQRALARAVHRALADEYRSRQAVESARRTMRRELARREDLAAGRYWPQRDTRRSAQRPVRVEVDPDAWEQFKRRCSTQGVTAGVRLGELAVEALGARLAVGGASKRRTLFVRIAIDDDAWDDVRMVAEAAGLTVARLLGWAVESLLEDPR